MIHETGHYVAGKILKFKIEEFSIGFGPKIFSKKLKSGEVFSLRWIPLGGFCAFKGEDEDEEDESVDQEGTFNSYPCWKRLIVLFSGAFLNFVSGIIFVLILLTSVGSGIVKVTDLNLRSKGSTDGDRLGNLTYGDRVEIYEKSDNWGRTKDGWVCLDYIYQDGTTGSKTANGTITGSQLNIRSGPGKGYATVGSYNAGDKVTILEQFTYNGTTWGCTNQGWISMEFVDVSNSNSTETNEDGSKNGTVIGNGLNIRSGAGADYPAVGTLNYGDRVTILEQKKVGDTTWGKTSKGWISLDYVSMD
jgi:uncharacterized protein YgiM (DUF1202 family)